MNAVNQTQRSLNEYLKERDEIGKIILRDLVEPLFNLITLSKEVQSRNAAVSDEDKSSLDILVNLSESVLSNVVHLHNLSFNNDKLIFISLFHIDEMLSAIVNSQELSAVGKIDFKVVTGVDRIQVIGDKDIIHFWIVSILNNLHDHYGGSQKYSVSILNDDDLFVGIMIIIELTSFRQPWRSPLFINKKEHIGMLTKLLGAALIMQETDVAVNVTLKLSRNSSEKLTNTTICKGE